MIYKRSEYLKSMIQEENMTILRMGYTYIKSRNIAESNKKGDV